MSELPHAVAALGLVASLMSATAAFANDESNAASAEPMSPEAQAAVELVSNGVAAKSADDPNCPTVSIAPDGDTRRLDGGRATLGALARDCAVLGAETIVKVGVVGESRRRRKGDAAGFDTPMTIRVKDADGREIETRRINLRVEMPEGVQRVSFRHVEENVSLPPPSADGYANWTIVVGFDPAASGGNEVAADEEVETEASARNLTKRSARSSKSRHYSSARSAAARRPARSSRSYAAVNRQPSGRMAVTLTPQSRAQDEGQGLARVTTEIKPRPAAPASIAAAAPARPTPAPARPISNASDSPWKKVATSFQSRRAAAQQPAQTQPQQRGRRPAGQTQAAAQTPPTTSTN